MPLARQSRIFESSPTFSLNPAGTRHVTSQAAEPVPSRRTVARRLGLGLCHGTETLRDARADARRLRREGERGTTGHLRGRDG